MLVLTLRPNLPVKVGEDVTVTVKEIGQGQVKVAFEAPKHIQILRQDAKVRKPKT